MLWASCLVGCIVVVVGFIVAVEVSCKDFSQVDSRSARDYNIVYFIFYFE